MIYRIYEWHLIKNLDTIPHNICFLISDSDMRQYPGKIQEVIRWCLSISDIVLQKKPDSKGIGEIMVHISNPCPMQDPSYLSELKQLSTFVRLTLHYGERAEVSGTGIPVTIAIGKSGREEIADAIRLMAENGVKADELSEQVLEQYLTFSHTPDCLIKTGGSHLVDFLIWQSVYSELFFLDLNWGNIRRVDLIRAFRDYHSRNRRFGA